MNKHINPLLKISKIQKKIVESISENCVIPKIEDPLISLCGSCDFKINFFDILRVTRLRPTSTRWVQTFCDILGVDNTTNGLGVDNTTNRRREVPPEVPWISSPRSPVFIRNNSVDVDNESIDPTLSKKLTIPIIELCVSPQITEFNRISNFDKRYKTLADIQVILVSPFHNEKVQKLILSTMKYFYFPEYRNVIKIGTDYKEHPQCEVTFPTLKFSVFSWSSGFFVDRGI